MGKVQVRITLEKEDAWDLKAWAAKRGLSLGEYVVLVARAFRREKIKRTFKRWKGHKP